VKTARLAHATALGCRAQRAESLDELGDELERARSADRTSVIVLRTAPDVWMEGGAFWEVGAPEESEQEEVRAARAQLVQAKRAQRVGC
jgi:3D-(3,5/4)-trihydroxycyclohexane-1,2-dione acylhydrolase (decyclizing)